MTSFKKRIVLKPDVSTSDFELVAWEKNWNLTNMGQEVAGATIDTWCTDDTETEIHFVDDRPIGLNYVTLHGEATDLVEEQIRTSLESWTLSEALAALNNASDIQQKSSYLYAVALTAPTQQDDTVVDQLQLLARDPEPDIRHSLIEATAYLPWPSLVKLVEDMSRNDPDETVKDDAKLLLDGLDASGEGPKRAEQ